MSGELLREAAALMRERADGAAQSVDLPGDWYRVSELTQCLVGPTESVRLESEHIASWHPVVALAVADWLDKLADSVCGRGCPRCQDADLMVLDGEQAIAVARAYLGRAA